MKIWECCKCGAEAKGETDSNYAASEFCRAFWTVHSGPECGPTDPETCRKARAAKEREEVPLVAGEALAAIRRDMGSRG